MNASTRLGDRLVGTGKLTCSVYEAGARHPDHLGDSALDGLIRDNPRPPDEVLGVYSSVIHYLKAVEALKSDDGTKIRDAFAKNLEGDTDCKTFKECSDALKAGKTIHYRGASSTFDKWAKTEPATGAYEVWSYDSAGKVVTEPADKQIKIS